MVESVFTSIPLSRAVVTKRCRKSWNRTRLHPACFRMVRSRFRQAAGSSGESSLAGEENIQRESTCCRYCRSTSTREDGNTTVRRDAFVLGTDTTSSPLAR